MLNKLLTRNTTTYKLIRTIIQGVLGVIVANLDYIIGTFHFSPEMKSLIVALVMAIMSPVMSELGKHTLEDVEDFDFIEEAD